MVRIFTPTNTLNPYRHPQRVQNNCENSCTCWQNSKAFVCNNMVCLVLAFEYGGKRMERVLEIESSKVEVEDGILLPQEGFTYLFKRI